MNKLIMVLGLITMPLIGFCDTLDYWHVYYNDSIIARFDAFSQDLEIEINRAKIDIGDTLTVRHVSLSACSDCTFFLFVRNEKKQKLRITTTDIFFDKLSFDIKDLIEFGDKYESKRYDFYYWERGENGYKTRMKPVLQMILID